MNADLLSEGRIFIDTNILVYAHDRSSTQKHSIAKQMIEECWQKEIGCISVQVLQEFFVTVTRKIPTPLDIQTAREVVTNFAYWPVHIPETTDVLNAIDLHTNQQLSFWDAMIVQSALSMGCRVLVSEDLSYRGYYATVQVINPFLD